MSAPTLVQRLVGARVDAGHGDRVAYLDPDVGPVTYGRLRDAARAYATSLRAAGVPTGTRGLVVADDSISTVVAVLGMWWHGCVPTMASPMLTDDELRLIATDAEPRCGHLDASAKRQESLAAGVFADLAVTSGDSVRAWFSPDDPTIDAAATDARPAAEPAPGEEALVQYTSGSTGAPKGVRHSAAAIAAMLDAFGAVDGFTADDVVLSTARLTFGYGFGSSLLRTLDAGATAALLRGPVDAHAVTAALRRHRPTVLCAVPRMYAALLEQCAQPDNGDLLDSVRLCLSAGENCPADLALRIERASGARLVTCFGATEVMHVVIATPPAGAPVGSLGVPVPGVTATVRDETGAVVPDGVEGRLHIAGPTVSLGYINRPDAQQAAFADGGAYTGDVVRRDADGFFHHVCRVDNVLNLGGYKVVPTEIEGVVRQADSVAQCAVVGSVDDNGLEQAVLYVVPRAGTEPVGVRREVLKTVRKRLPSFKRPSRIEVVPDLPTTSTGKLAAYLLRADATRREAVTT